MNPVVHFEIPYLDRQRIATFYESAFSWKIEMLGEDMGNYVLATTAIADAKKGSAAGAINGGFYPKKPDWPAQYPSVVIGVEDIKTAIKKVAQAGGEVLGEPYEIPGIGHYVSFMDSEGNRVSMLQPMRHSV
ncbi:MAG: VOC family protein [Burkholderiaceae bacterium]|jgi:predicted enzyme related to lactoylglutathione lyase